MCGISAMFLESSLDFRAQQQLIGEFLQTTRKIKHRGPDRTRIIEESHYNFVLAFERLAIMDLSRHGDQPFICTKTSTTGDHFTTYAMCNGEMYNHQELVHEHDLHPQSHSDCEIIPLLYEKYGLSGLDEILTSFNSEHAFMILEINHREKSYKLIVSEDRFGIRPLFTGRDSHSFYISSELQGIPHSVAVVERFPPRYYLIIDYENGQFTGFNYHQYYSLSTISPSNTDMADCMRNIASSLEQAVETRLQTHRPLGCLLSGGVDSSLVSALAAKILKGKNLKLNTFSIGMEGSTDEKFAKMVAAFIGSEHRHITVDEQDFINAVPDIVRTIGSFDRTTVRASTGQYLISKWISENTDIKVLLCGDGSDEVCGSYKYFHKAPSDQDFHAECLRLLENIHLFDGLRADRCISHFGLEARFPFLDHRFVRAYLSSVSSLRRPYQGMEKFLLRESFKEAKILPEEVLFRSKTAFSDGVSSRKRSWHEIIQNKIDQLISDQEFQECRTHYTHIPPLTKESLYYRQLFEETFGKNATTAATIPEEWLPKWCGDVIDPSARVLTDLCKD